MNYPEKICELCDVDGIVLASCEYVCFSPHSGSGLYGALTNCLKTINRTTDKDLKNGTYRRCNIDRLFFRGIEFPFVLYKVNSLEYKQFFIPRYLETKIEYHEIT